MNTEHCVLLVGGTGRTGGRVLIQLLERGVAVRAIVRSASRLPEGAAGHPLLTLVEADLLSLSPEELQRHLGGCDTVISCLGHTISLTGVMGPPFDLVARAMARLAKAAKDMRPARPVRFILMSTVSVNQPHKADLSRGLGERVFLGVLRAVIPPARDNQRAADLLARQIGANDPSIEWVVVRPDTLLEGDITGYTVHDQCVSSIFRPGETNMSNVAHFMCELTTAASLWERWRSKMPMVVNEQ